MTWKFSSLLWQIYGNDKYRFSFIRVINIAFRQCLACLSCSDSRQGATERTEQGKMAFFCSDAYSRLCTTSTMNLNSMKMCWKTPEKTVTAYHVFHGS